MSTKSAPVIKKYDKLFKDDEDVEDIVGDVKYTDSQKSVTISNIYSSDFTDSSSDKNMPSSKETYVIDQDDSDYSDKTFHIQNNKSPTSLRQSPIKQYMERIRSPVYKVSKSVCTSSLQQCSMLAQEIFTQTSKTIIELAQNETIHKISDSRNLETQTSFLSIRENKTMECTIKLTNNRHTSEKQEIESNVTSFSSSNSHRMQEFDKIYHGYCLTKSLEDKSSLVGKSPGDKHTDIRSDDTIDANVIKFIDDESNENMSYTETLNENISDIESSKFNSDVEEDSLNENYENKNGTQNNSCESIPNSLNNDIERIYSDLPLNNPAQATVSHETDYRKFRTLTPLTEETIQKNESIIDVTPSMSSLIKTSDKIKNYMMFTNISKIKMKSSTSDAENKPEGERLMLPPINRNSSFPSSPLVNLLFTLNNQPLPKADNHALGRWEIGTKDLASGESPRICGKNGEYRKTNKTSEIYTKSDQTFEKEDLAFDKISIRGRIHELKQENRKNKTRFESRSGSPSSVTSPEDMKLSDVVEKGCETLCSELLRRLRSCSWAEITETLDYLPKSLEEFWSIIPEHRIADLIRQVTVHIDSPRTHVARLACTALAEVLKNTNYTKKPDFYEGMGALLTKTSSFNRPVRRAANFALDSIVSTVELSHAVTAICIYGVEHKSPLVRCASARLLVVCCALAEGGRQLLRTRPPTAAIARRHALRALAQLLHDKNLETRKYAERLYAMLRPLPNFEAFFLTDVDVELATNHMKKYDQIVAATQSR